jgi:N-acetyl-gamma-glutamyl-phosphate reductase
VTGAPASEIPAFVLGGSGYVAGELLRILCGHPRFRIAAVASESRAGEAVVATFPHLRGTSIDGLTFAAAGAVETLLAAGSSGGPLALFSALPHGEAATRLDALLTLAETSGTSVRVVDLSADFRHRDPERYAAVYGKPHPAPHRLPQFHCTVPELHPLGSSLPDSAVHVAHPGCFTTAATLALAPFVALGLIEPFASVVAVTGSTGAGRTPTATTHHPERRSDLFAYSPLAHRHEPEMRALLAAVAPGPAPAPEVSFVPHSGPFARGIHATITARLIHSASVEDLLPSVFPFYESFASLPLSSPSPSPSPSSSPSSSSSSSSLPFTEAPSSFVRFQESPPRLQAVVGTNRCDLSFAVRDRELVIFTALDNLVKGAAGGAVQWMNRLFALPERSGLDLPGLGWL